MSSEVQRYVWLSVVAAVNSLKAWDFCAIYAVSLLEGFCFYAELIYFILNTYLLTRAVMILVGSVVLVR